MHACKADLATRLHAIGASRRVARGDAAPRADIMTSTPGGIAHGRSSDHRSRITAGNLDTWARYKPADSPPQKFADGNGESAGVSGCLGPNAFLRCQIAAILRATFVAAPTPPANFEIALRHCTSAVGARCWARLTFQTDISLARNSATGGTTRKKSQSTAETARSTQTNGFAIIGRIIYRGVTIIRIILFFFYSFSLIVLFNKYSISGNITICVPFISL